VRVTGLRPALIAIAGLGALLTVLAVVLSLTAEHMSSRGIEAGVTFAVMAGYIGTGLFAWSRRPHNRTGALMTAVGFAYFLAILTASDQEVVFTIGLLLSNVFLVVALHMVLAFPTGRLGSRGLRRLVGTGYVASILLQLAWMLFSPDVCTDCSAQMPDNVFAVTDSATGGDIALIVASVIATGILAAGATVLVQRWRVATKPARRALGPVLFTGLALLIALTTLFIAQAIDSSGNIVDVVNVPVMLAFAALPFAFLAGLMRNRWSRAGAVGELVERLGVDRASLTETLSDAMGDPTLRLAYWLPQAGRFVDGTGHTMDLPGEDDPYRAATMVERNGERIGALVHDRSLCEEPELVSASAAAAALAMANERLEAELRARLEDLSESRAKLIATSLAERQRLERDLHDGAQQRLVALSLQVHVARAKITSDPEAAGAILDRARDELRLALEELRELARGIHPAVLTDRGLGAAIAGLASRFPMPVQVLTTPLARLPASVEAAAYFVVSESLANMAKHAGASRATVRVARQNGTALVEVHDDGCGGASMEAGSGLRGLADRLAALDGRLEVVSPPGQGTTVRARIPCESS
jgi:signal transduction histidine kinase